MVYNEHTNLLELDYLKLPQEKENFSYRVSDRELKERMLEGKVSIYERHLLQQDIEATGKYNSKTQRY